MAVATMYFSLVLGATYSRWFATNPRRDVGDTCTLGQTLAWCIDFFSPQDFFCGPTASAAMMMGKRRLIW
jgi:hypothetical protein